MPNLQADRLWLPRFRFRPERAAEAVDLIARASPGLTQYFVGKILYLADKSHFLDWGRPVTFDRYVAMKHGPVPSAIRNMLAAAAGVNAGMGEIQLAGAQADAEQLRRRVRVELEVALNGERQRVYPMAKPLPYAHLSGSDIEALQSAIRDHGGKGFGSLRDMTHKDDAWKVAWGSRGNRSVYDIDMTNWAPAEERAAVREQLREYSGAAIG
jgi:uncharacterized phage-associated protein